MDRSRQSRGFVIKNTGVVNALVRVVTPTVRIDVGVAIRGISGYAWDANDDQGTVNVAVYVDGAFYVVVPAQEAYTGIGSGYHGFRFATPASLKDGQQHSILVRYSGSSTTLNNSPKIITCNGG